MEDGSATKTRALDGLALCQAVPEVPLPPLSGPIGLAVGRSAYRLTLELVEAARSAAVDLGIQARVVGPLDDRTGLRTLLGIGFQRDFLAVLDAGRNDYPGCPQIAWVGEPLLPPGETSGGLAARLGRSPLLDLARLPLRPLRGAPLPRPLARVRGEMLGEWERYRNTLDLDRAARLCDELVVTNRVAAATLARRGLSASVVPWGYAAAVAGELLSPDMGDRDLAVVALGRTDAWVAWRRRELARLVASEPQLTVAENVWGPERNALLRRSRVVLNVQRVPGNFVGLRLLLALAAGAVVVTEPMTDPYPFVPGIHYVEAPLDRLLDESRGLLADEKRRRRIAEAGQALLSDELTMVNSLRRVLAVAQS